MTRHARKFLARVLAFVLVAASAAFAADDTKILFPGGAGSTPSPTAPSGGSLGKVTLLVGVVLAAAGGWFVWRGRSASPLGREVRQLSLSETRSLGNRQFLVVATYENKKFLLGVCPGRIDLIAPLHDAPLLEKSRS